MHHAKIGGGSITCNRLDVILTGHHYDLLLYYFFELVMTKKRNVCHSLWKTAWYTGSLYVLQVTCISNVVGNYASPTKKSKMIITYMNFVSINSIRHLYQ